MILRTLKCSLYGLGLWCCGGFERCGDFGWEEKYIVLMCNIRILKGRNWIGEIGMNNRYMWDCYWNNGEGRAGYRE